ncbi:pyridoxal phosphate-dependent aminotransferase [Campylobacter sp. RM9344]|uniref:cysteine-S-conjugate beta-lyase n=2 Tax=Campylobacter californiensis TaxID=1032243 RepID=A0AAW3ZSJ3_9BACT|nr:MULTISPECIES: MalY/PatB family protein [unclassified Campylobacter]MBE2986735.1 pyridoxal phosphate-dependent aminotransferase [Campylobacter sp. RM12919]MBE2988471.1 pyridoxal phosphate-dependent aminotransferase [Campylobacter sp. RM12920]MBE2995231.1 pyridoxal phosphate-dependent aminotransferase [Campylobacter sp. RM6913]MBE3022085.1 pyridoxal phosphate-dependent aminotransferase [Campylobacter sp. 7477a]MBE3029512.1 pyridoxal phosphate-dependent aminotransferase [Campylobacter sp. RM93
MKYDFDTLVDRSGTNSSKWRTNGDELPMWVADMDFKAAPEILSAIQKRLDNGVFGYSYIPNEWNEAICSWWQRRHGVKFEPNSMMFCTGIVPAMSSAVRKFTSVGDKVVVQAPVYHLFFNCITNNGRQVLSNDLVYENGEYCIDFDDLEEKLSDPLTTMMLLCNPQNPAGKIWSKTDLARIGELCYKYGVLVLSDEIHCDLTDPGKSYVPFASINEICAQNSITCVSATKAFNIAGLQTSAVIVPNKTLRVRMNRALNTDEVAEANAFAITATIAAFNEGEAWLDELNRYVYENKLLVKEFIERENLPIRLVPSDATYLLWLDCSKICENSSEFTKFLREKAGLWLNDGNAYRGGKCFVRMNIATQKERVLEGLRRLKAGVLAYQNAK